MAQLKCPLLDELSALVTCRLSEVEAERIYAHLEVCPECDATVTELELNRQPLIPEGNEGPTDVPFEQEPAFQRMMAAVMGGSTAILEADSISGSTDVFEKSLGKYVIIEKVGEGGMGIVYRARHRQLNRIVALKVLQSSRLNDVAAISRFRREISLVGQLQHPNIVQAHDGGEEDGVHFLVMEFVEGRNLSEIVRQNGPLTIAAACELTIQATIGLQYAFERGLIHRDIKPSNLMLTAGDRTSEGERPIVKILDLGLARLLDSNANPFERINKLTMSGQVIGTVDYMAPEQGGDSHAVDIRADLYALGAVLFELLTGAPPYSKFSQLPPLQKLMAIARNPPPAIRTLRPEVPKRLAAIVARLLSKQPETRYATPREVTLALQPFRSGADLAVLLACTDSIVSYRSTIQSNRPSLAPRRQLSKRVIWGVFVVATVLSCGVSLVVSQARGVVVLESPDGQLPVDVKVIVLRGGEEIAVLQANNQWRATIRSGPIDLQMTKGQERFELVDSSRVVNRFGKNIVSLSQRLSNLEQPVLATPGATQKKPLSKTVRMTLANPDVRNAAIRLLKEARAELGLTRNWADSEKSSSSDIWFVSTEADLPSDDMIVTEILIVNGPSISDLWTLIDRFPHLTTLKLDYHITPMDCDRIGMLTELRALSVGAASDQLALCLQNLRQLESLCLPGKDVTDSSSVVWTKMIHLRDLSLHNSRVTVKSLDMMPMSLGSLRIGNSAIRGKDLVALKRFPQLGDLSLSGDQLDAAGFQALVELPIAALAIAASNPADWSQLRLPASLRELSISTDQRSVPKLKRLSEYPGLQTLQLHNCLSSSELWDDLSQCTQLQSLVIYATSCSEEDLKLLRMRLPRCTISYKP